MRCTVCGFENRGTIFCELCGTANEIELALLEPRRMTWQMDYDPYATQKLELDYDPYATQRLELDYDPYATQKLAVGYGAYAAQEQASGYNAYDMEQTEVLYSR